MEFPRHVFNKTACFPCKSLNAYNNGTDFTTCKQCPIYMKFVQASDPAPKDHGRTFEASCAFCPKNKEPYVYENKTEYVGKFWKGDRGSSILTEAEQKHNSDAMDLQITFPVIECKFCPPGFITDPENGKSCEDCTCNSRWR